MTDSKRDFWRSVLTVTIVAVMIAEVAAGLFLLLGYKGTWRHVPYKSIFSSLFRYVGAALGMFIAYHAAQIAVKMGRERKGEEIPLWSYVRCVLACGVLGLVIGDGLGKHVEDADPLRGGGEIVIDFVPSGAERATYGVKVFLGALLPGLFGTAAGLKIESSKKADEEEQ